MRELPPTPAAAYYPVFDRVHLSMDSHIWQRRSNTTNKTTSGSTGSSSKDNSFKIDSSRGFGSVRRGGDTPSSKGNPFNAVTSGPSGGLSTPTAGASSAFGLGSGAFASFGASKTKTPGASATEGGILDKPGEALSNKQSNSSLNKASLASSEHLLKSTWVVWYRPPTSKNSDYEKSMTALASFSTIEQFALLYRNLKRPSSLPIVSDYHIFKKGIRPVWEDEENKRGGKWIVRLRKGVADRYWEDLLFAMIGGQFAEADDEVCGAVLSVRTGEDVLSIWTRVDGGRNVKIRETVKRLLSFPADTIILWKSHDSSIAQRTAIDQARQEKASTSVPLRRRDTLLEETTPERSR